MITKRLPTEELIHREAQKLALEAYIRDHKIPATKSLPDNIMAKIDALLSATPIYHDRAKQNILAQKAAHEEALKSIGLNPIEVDPLELDL